MPSKTKSTVTMMSNRERLMRLKPPDKLRQWLMLRNKPKRI